MAYSGKRARSTDTAPADEEYTNGKQWIAGAIGKPGSLHKQMGVPMGEKIPAAALEKASHAGGKLGRRARLAETLKGFHK